MEFVKYQSIENSYIARVIQTIKDNMMDKIPYVVQEKAHGANFAIYIDDVLEYKFAKRTNFIGEDESFYQYEDIFKYKKRFTELFVDVGAMKNFDYIVIYGELIGGSYPHKDVNKANTPTIQKGVFYTPNIEFYGYDIRIRKGDSESFLDYDTVSRLFKKHQIPFANKLFEGNLDECLNYPNDGLSQIYKQFNLPPIENNIMEGVVIKPVYDDRINGQRIILKNKNEKFIEKEKVKKEYNPEKYRLWGELEELSLELKTYVTKNRFDNLKSKLGELDITMFDQIFKMFTDDVFSDFEKESENSYELFESLNKSDRKLVMKNVNNKIIHLIKTYLIRGD